MFAYYSKFIKNFSDKLYQLNQNEIFHSKLKEDLKDVMLVTVDYDEGFEVETDASAYCIAATLNQQGCPTSCCRKRSSSNCRSFTTVATFFTWKTF